MDLPEDWFLSTPEKGSTTASGLDLAEDWVLYTLPACPETIDKVTGNSSGSRLTRTEPCQDFLCAHNDCVCDKDNICAEILQPGLCVLTPYNYVQHG